METDYQIGEDLKEKVRVLWIRFITRALILIEFSQIIPRAVDYFTGKALEYEVLDEDDDDFEDLEDDEDEDGFDDDVRISLSSFPYIVVC